MYGKDTFVSNSAQSYSETMIFFMFSNTMLIVITMAAFA